MLEPLRASMQRIAGIRCLEAEADVHRGTVGRSDCEVSVATEACNGVFWVAIKVVLRRGRSSVTRVVKWPYSRSAAGDLAALLAELDALAAGPGALSLRDPRGAIARWFDRLVRRGYLGRRSLESLVSHTPRISVDVDFEQTDGQLLVTLTERRPSRGTIMAQMPLAALPAIAAALRRCQQRLVERTAVEGRS